MKLHETRFVVRMVKRVDEQVAVERECPGHPMNARTLLLVEALDPRAAHGAGAGHQLLPEADQVEGHLDRGGIAGCAQDLPCLSDLQQAMARGIEAATRAAETHFAFGDLFLADVRAYRERQFAGSGIEPLFPIWASAADTPSTARRMIHEGTRAVIVCVDTEQLPSEFLGREYDAAFLADLPAGVDPCGERGEFHTLCYDGPAFRYPLAPVAGEVVRRGRFHFMDQALVVAPAAT